MSSIVPSPLHAGRLRAAAYVRMSTERQVYSTANQLDRIRQYAADRDIDLVAIYEDAGKSGLTKRGRAGLSRLIDDVQRARDFTLILVYDVSRWGRFQDLDESAHYEYVCRANGVNVAYCAEAFENDGSPFAAVFKALKRAAAAEYSRELSAKVFAAQCRMIKLGYKSGGPAGYALRRAIADADGSLIRILNSGEWKAVQTHRVVLVPGPADEIAVVIQIFKWYAEDGIGDRRIAAVLNEQGIPTEAGGPWTPDIIRCMLRNEKYIGNLIFNKASFKLRKTAVRNPPGEWVRCDGAFPAIVPTELFAAASRERARRYRRYTKPELLAALHRIYEAHGRISSTLIDADPSTPTARLIGRHFGTLFEAYAEAGIPNGLTNDFLITRRQNYALRDRMVLEASRLIDEAGAVSEKLPAPHTLRINGGVTVSLRIIRCCHEKKHEYYRWRIPSNLADGCDFLLVALLDRTNRFITTHLLLSAAELADRNVAVTETSISRYAANRRDHLADFFLPHRSTQDSG